MGIFSGLVAPSKFGAINPLDDRYYQYNSYTGYGSYGGQSLTGLLITEDTAMMASAVWACVRVISETLATVPLITYRRLPDDRRERATSYYLYDILHDQPNEYQTAFEFREMMTAHCLLTGNAYARLMPGRRGAADQLVPMHPNRMQITTVNGEVIYRYTEPDGRSTTYSDSEIFHLRGLSNGGGLSSLGSAYSTDGRLGMSVLQYAREAIGLTLALQQYGARLFSQGTQLSGVLTHPGKLSADAQKRLRDTWMQKHSGLNQAHKPAILEEGMKWESIQMSNEDAQFLASRAFQVADIARWFRVPLHMIQETTPSTSWGSGIEQLSLAFVIYTLLPWARRWEQAIARDLIVQTGQYYAEYLFDSLLRGDIKSRYEAYAVARNWGWMSANDIRRRENEDPIDAGDIYLQPLNMVEAGAEPPEPEPAAPAGAQPMERMGDGMEGEGAPQKATRLNGHYVLLLNEAAQRVIRKEEAAMAKAAKRCADDPDEWRAAIEEFYGDHAEYIVRVLGMARNLARDYVTEQKLRLRIRGVAAMEDWGARRVADLVARAMECDQDD